MSETFPRLLIATEFPPNAPGGGPAVVRQMLKDWPIEKLFWWSCLPDLNECFGQKTRAHCVAPIPQRLYPHQRAPLLKSWLLEHLWVPQAARHFKRSLEKLRPEVIWVIPHQWAIPPLASVLMESHANFHVTVQDYMDTHGPIQRFGHDRCQRLARMAEQLYARAGSRDATSHPMIADLLAKTGCPASQMLHAGIEPDELGEWPENIVASTDRIRIGYAGTIMVEREFAFFVSALEKIRSRLMLPVSLEFFGNHSYRTRDWFDPEWMNEHGNLSSALLSAALKKCTWGFSPMALDDNDPRYNRYSFPTKFISYLAAGLPVITLGHLESSVVKMASQYDVGLWTSTTEAETLSAQLLAALSAPNPKLKYAPEIRRCALNEFDARRMRSILYDSFAKCAASA